MEIEPGSGLFDIDIADSSDATLSVGGTGEAIRMGLDCEEPNIDVRVSTSLDPEEARSLADELHELADEVEEAEE